jgi:hypothetical protein
VTGLGLAPIEVWVGDRELFTSRVVDPLDPENTVSPE